MEFHHHHHFCFVCVCSLCVLVGANIGNWVHMASYAGLRLPSIPFGFVVEDDDGFFLSFFHSELTFPFSLSLCLSFTFYCTSFHVSVYIYLSRAQPHIDLKIQWDTHFCTFPCTNINQRLFGRCIPRYSLHIHYVQTLYKVLPCLFERHN